MRLHVVLDACVLIPMPLADTLLHLAEASLYQPVWSATLLEETRRNLVSKLGLTQDRATRRIELMRSTFPWAEIRPTDRLVGAMTVDDHDRHVAAAAVTAGATLIVTLNLKDFPDDALSPFGITAIHPDEFLLDLLDLDPIGVAAALERQRRRLRTPPVDVEAFHQALAATVPKFIAQLASLPDTTQRSHEDQAAQAGMPMPIVTRTIDQMSNALFPGGKPDALTPHGVIALWWTAICNPDHPDATETLTRLCFDPDHWENYAGITEMVEGYALTTGRHPDLKYPDSICYFKLIHTEADGEIFADYVVQDPMLFVMLIRKDLYEPWRVLALGPQPWIDLDDSDAGGPTAVGEVLTT